MHRSNYGIPREVSIIIGSDEEQSSSSESSVGDDGTGGRSRGFYLFDVVESTYNDLENSNRGPPQSLEDRNDQKLDRKQIKDHTDDPAIDTTFSPGDRSTSLARDNFPEIGYENANDDERRKLLVAENEYTPVHTDKIRRQKNHCFDVACVSWEVLATLPREDTTHSTKKRRKKQFMSNLRTRVERMQCQMKKPFCTVSKMILCSAGRFQHIVCQVPDRRLQYDMNQQYLLQKGNKSRILLSDDYDDDEKDCPIPHVVSLGSSDTESKGEFSSCGQFQEILTNEDSERLGKKSVLSHGNDEKHKSDELRWLYARQLLPVND